ncbi:ribosomal subunit interface protein [Kineococcus xinjiangensis]|uniref:Ribosome hibernation promoting factor n=1 Tax=Kineococcus xinjiangensis TaxID=512762 RepID=A0A2S6IU87_9ACTN|nr:ribosome-associated translation inhibitor RaiA [Kineococcus xinjiangensis]PPK97822.1 ribosomal subunit interface protein [Kineococcus xinjiangensis]
MEVVVTGRRTDVPDRFRRHVEEKLEKVSHLAPRAQRIDVELSHEPNKRQASSCERVEITVRDKGPVIRAEACADDPYGALDLATGKLLERLRRARDRKKVHHGRHTPKSVHDATAGLAPAGGGTSSGLSDPALAASGSASAPDVDEDVAGATGGAEQDQAPGSPVVIREKEHVAHPMTLDQALYEMELVGHDFFLFQDSASGRPSVVYRRKGWSYGVITLDVVDPESNGAGSAAAAERAVEAVGG